MSHLPLLHAHPTSAKGNAISKKHMEHLVQNQHRWSDGQKRGHEIIQSSIVEGSITLLVVVQMCLGIHQTDLAAANIDAPLWMRLVTCSCLMIYCIEIGVRFYVYRLDFFRSKWHWLDLGVVAIDVVGVLLAVATSGKSPLFAVLRVFRVFRVARAAKLLRFFPELFIMVHSLAGTIRVVFWAILMVLLMMTVFSIMAVDIIHPINVTITRPGDRCWNAFDSVFSSNLTFLQVIVAGDSFGACTMPIMRAKPWTVLYFTAVLATLGLGAMNLVLSAIVDRAQEVRSENEHLLHLAKVEAYERAKNAIVNVCATDLAENGMVTLEALLYAADNHDVFSGALEKLSLGKADVQTIYFMMDEERIGSVSYEEFGEHLFKLKTQEGQMILIPIRHFMNEMKRDLKAEFDLMKTEQCELQQIARRVSKFDKAQSGSQQSPKTASTALDDVEFRCTSQDAHRQLDLVEQDLIEEDSNTRQWSSEPVLAAPPAKIQTDSMIKELGCVGKLKVQDSNAHVLEEPPLAVVSPKDKLQSANRDIAYIGNSLAQDNTVQETLCRMQTIERAVNESILTLQASVQEITGVAQSSRQDARLKQGAFGPPAECKWNLPAFNAQEREQKLKVVPSERWPCCAAQEHVVQILPVDEPNMYRYSCEPKTPQSSLNKWAV